MTRARGSMTPFYRFTGRRPNPPYTDILTWQNEHNPKDQVSTSEWSYWRLWSLVPGNEAHPEHISHQEPVHCTLCGVSAKTIRVANGICDDCINEADEADG